MQPDNNRTNPCLMKRVDLNIVFDCSKTKEKMKKIIYEKKPPQVGY